MTDDLYILAKDIPDDYPILFDDGSSKPVNQMEDAEMVVTIGFYDLASYPPNGIKVHQYDPEAQVPNIQSCLAYTAMIRELHRHGVIYKEQP